MSKLLSGSIVWRILLWLGLSCRESVAGRICRALGRSWRGSRTKRFFVNRLDAPASTTASSRANRVLCWWNACLARVHRFPACVRGSLICRLWRAIVRACAGSRLLGWVFRGGTNAVLLFLIALYTPIHFLMLGVSIPVLTSTWDELLLLVCFGWILWQRMDRTQPLPTRSNPLDAPVFVFLGIGLALMFAVCPFFGIAVAGYRATVQYILWFYVAARMIRDDADLLRIYATLVAIALLVALHGIYQYIVAVPIPAKWVAAAETSVRTRVYSIFGSPNIMGCFMTLFAPMAVALAYYVKNRWLKLGCWAAGGCMCLACLFTMSRGAWVAMAAAVLVFAILQDRRLLVVILIAGAVALCLPFVQTRLGFLLTPEYQAASANGGRGSRWDIGLGYLMDSNPWLGFGLGMFGGAIAVQNKVYPWISYFYMDNYYLKILVEMGYLGLAAFLFMMAGLFCTGLRAVWRTKKQRSRFSPLVCGMLSGMAGVMVHCYSENIFEEPYMMAMFWLLAAMIVYLGFLRKPEKC